MVIANSWPNEPLPTGTYARAFTPLYPGSDESLQITAQLAAIDQAIEKLDAETLYQQRLYDVLHANLRRVEDIRWRLVEGSSSALRECFSAR